MDAPVTGAANIGWFVTKVATGVTMRVSRVEVVLVILRAIEGGSSRQDGLRVNDDAQHEPWLERLEEIGKGLAWLIRRCSMEKEEGAALISFLDIIFWTARWWHVHLFDLLLYKVR